ncbi:hypothetical protein D3C73_1143660 [compost metagenome]
MDYISNKALVIAVGVFVTLAIASGVLYTISTIKDIYKGVNQTDISIKKDFKEFDMYENTQFTGIGVYNTAKKYLKNGLVTVNVVESTGTRAINNDVQIARIEDMLNKNTAPYKNDSKFNATYIEDDRGRITITFRII